MLGTSEVLADIGSLVADQSGVRFECYTLWLPVRDACNSHLVGRGCEMMQRRMFLDYFGLTGRPVADMNYFVLVVGRPLGTGERRG